MPVILATVIGVAVFAGNGFTYAAPAPASPPSKVTTTSDIVHLTAAQCIVVRQHAPRATCTVRHTVTETDAPAVSTSIKQNVVLTAGGCFNGAKYFTDTYTNTDWFSYQLQIITSFRWDGYCELPTGFNGPQCQVNFTDVPISNQGCYYWYSAQFNATEGKYLAFVGIKGVGYTAGVYRGCRADASCYNGWV